MSSKTSINTLGASNLSEKERSERDFYSTNPESVRQFLKLFNLPKDKIVWDPGSGHNKIIDTVKEFGYNTRSTDIYDYGYQDEILDFLAIKENWPGTILMNPPYKLALEFVEQALNLVETGNLVIAYLRTLFLEGQKRYNKLFKENPPKYIYVFSKRQVCSAKDDFTEGSAISYSFFVWEKGNKTEPIVRWIYTE